MENLIHADIFFFVTTILIILFAIPILVSLIYIALIIRTLHSISKEMRDGLHSLAESVKKFKDFAYKETTEAGNIIGILKKIIKRPRRKS